MANKNDAETYQVIKNTRRPLVPVIDGKVMPFDHRGFMRVKDSGEAAEIKARYMPDVTVTKRNIPHVADRGHKYFFGGWPEMPWKKKKEE